MTLQVDLTQVFAVCALCAAVQAVAGEDAPGVHAVCGLSIALTVARLVLKILG